LLVRFDERLAALERKIKKALPSAPAESGEP